MPYEWVFYLAGAYKNAIMNKLIYPEWETWIHVDTNVYIDNQRYLLDLAEVTDVKIVVAGKMIHPCEAMLWRLMPLWEEDVTHVICRDLDAITTYRETKSVERWIESGKTTHGMNDNQAHGGLPLMGGMCGFKKKAIQYPSFEYLIDGYDLSPKGSDQQLLMKRIYPVVCDDIYFDRYPEHYPYTGLAESDLVCKHIGSAGINDMEFVRFINKWVAGYEKYIEFEHKYPNLFYW